MRWGPATLAELVRSFNVPHRLLPVFAALAIATSGGHDDYDVSAGTPGSGRWQGLYGVNVDRYPEYTGCMVGDPWMATRAAVQLTQATHDWSWTPQWETRQWVNHYRDCVNELAARPWQDHEHVPIASVVHDQLGSIHLLRTGSSRHG